MPDQILFLLKHRTTRFLALAFVFLLPFAACTQNANRIPYRFSDPSAKLVLSSPKLIEISGLDLTEDAKSLIAIADEMGEVFFLDTTTGNIRSSVLFRDKGDFEGVERVGKSLYAVKSNGSIYHLDNWEKSDFTLNVYPTSLSKSNDIEGLCFDSGRNALLLACKQEPTSDTVRCIFAFDLTRKQLGETPVYTIYPQEVENLIPNDPDGKNKFFSPSAISIHPISKQIYVLSSAKRSLICIDYQSGKILDAVKLPKNLLPQPEGITFDDKGNLFISSEGKKGAPGVILRFDHPQ